jgi:hypothetical protein
MLDYTIPELARVSLGQGKRRHVRVSLKGCRPRHYGVV